MAHSKRTFPSSFDLEQDFGTLEEALGVTLAPNKAVFGVSDASTHICIIEYALPFNDKAPIPDKIKNEHDDRDEDDIFIDTYYGDNTEKLLDHVDSDYINLTFRSKDNLGEEFSLLLPFDDLEAAVNAVDTFDTLPTIHADSYASLSLSLEEHLQTEEQPYLSIEMKKAKGAEHGIISFSLMNKGKKIAFSEGRLIITKYENDITASSFSNFINDYYLSQEL